jgi:hypothetical protein
LHDAGEVATSGTATLIGGEQKLILFFAIVCVEISFLY